jgi:hypothetical protein
MSNITNSMFESIRGALASSEDKPASTNILRTEPGNTYTVRLLPYMKDPKKTFYHYYQHGWNSFATGQYVSALSPQTFGERDPIAESRYKLYRGNDEDKAIAGKIIRSEKWLVNVYVVNDPVTPDNNGKVMVLRYGKQLHKVITSAIDGEDSSDLGARVFDLTPNGVNFKIVVEKQGDFPTYVSSKFSFPTEVKGLEESGFDDIYNAGTELDSIFKFKSYDELKQMVNEHIFCKDDDSERSESYNAQAVTNGAPTPVLTPVYATQPKPATQSDDSDIQDLLAGLDL